MATKGDRIDFMFLGLPSYPAAGSATENRDRNRVFHKLDEIGNNANISIRFFTM